MKAMAEINQKTDERRFGYDKELQGERQTFEAGQNKEKRDFDKGLFGDEIKFKETQAAADRASAEGMAGARNAMTERLAKMENDLQAEKNKADKDDAYARNLQARIKAIEESRKITEMGGSIDEINAPLEAAGLPTMEEYEMVPGKKGLFSDEPPVTGMRRKGSGLPTSLSGAPKAGTVDSGYKFKGGDPADPKNWEKI